MYPMLFRPGSGFVSGSWGGLIFAFIIGLAAGVGFLYLWGYAMTLTPA